MVKFPGYKIVAQSGNWVRAEELTTGVRTDYYYTKCPMCGVMHYTPEGEDVRRTHRPCKESFSNGSVKH